MHFLYLASFNVLIHCQSPTHNTIYLKNTSLHNMKRLVTHSIEIPSIGTNLNPVYITLYPP